MTTIVAKVDEKQVSINVRSSGGADGALAVIPIESAEQGRLIEQIIFETSRIVREDAHRQISYAVQQALKRNK
jgi:hypothetical protein